MELKDALNAFYYNMSLSELRAMNGNEFLNKFSYNSLLYINVISQIPDCTVSKLAEKLNVTKSAITSKVNELVKQNLLVKEQSSDDLRVFFIRTTTELQNAENVYNRVFENMQGELNSLYTKEELMLFGKILEKISTLDWISISENN